MEINSLTSLSTCLRPCIRAPQGKKLVVADLSAIENRVLAWLSQCEPMLEVYEKGLDPYLSFGVEFYGKSYESITKDERQICKPAVLGCGYGLGPGMEITKDNGQKVKTGLWAYAESMGVKLDQSQCYDMVNTFRQTYIEVPEYWHYLEMAFFAAYKTRKRQQVGVLFFEADANCVKILLPSGRYIHYLNPIAYRDNGIKISFDGLRQGGWGRQTTWGGRLTENVVQAISRDVLAEGMLRAEATGLTIVGHVHDEIVTEFAPLEPSDSHHALKTLEIAMSDPISWASGLPLAAEGYESEFYMKG